MPCRDCKHWRLGKRRAAPDVGVCVLLSEDCKRAPDGQSLEFTAKSKARHKKRQGQLSTMVTWTPDHLMDRMTVVTYTSPEFFCALYDKDKRKKLRLKVVPDSTPRHYQILLEDTEAAPEIARPQ